MIYFGNRIVVPEEQVFYKKIDLFVYEHDHVFSLISIEFLQILKLISSKVNEQLKINTRYLFFVNFYDTFSYLCQ